MSTFSTVFFDLYYPLKSIDSNYDFLLESSIGVSWYRYTFWIIPTISPYPCDIWIGFQCRMGNRILNHSTVGSLSGILLPPLCFCWKRTWCYCFPPHPTLYACRRKLEGSRSLIVCLIKLLVLITIHDWCEFYYLWTWIWGFIPLLWLYIWYVFGFVCVDLVMTFWVYCP